MKYKRYYTLKHYYAFEEKKVNLHKGSCWRPGELVGQLNDTNTFNKTKQPKSG